MRLRPICAYPNLSRWLTRDTADNMYVTRLRNAPAGFDGDCVAVARRRRMTIRAFSIYACTAIHPPCDGCRVIVDYPLGVDDLS
jgi:hypothetical protein